MERLYRTMYRLGLTPWDQEQIPSQLITRIAAADRLEPGVALDLGCGTGRHATYLAEHGWEVTGIDVAPRAIALARSRSARVSWALADLNGESITPIKERLRDRATLILDVGCLHGLDDTGRAAWSHIVNTVAAPGASLLLRAASPRPRQSIGPRGILPEEITSRLGPGWERISAASSSDWTEFRRITS